MRVIKKKKKKTETHLLAAAKADQLPGERVECKREEPATNRI